MAEPTPTAPVAAPNNSGGFLKRELNGATFLTLEHVGHMVLVLVVTLLVCTGILTAFSLWMGSGGVGTMLTASNPMMSMLGGAGVKYIESSVAVGVVAALLVLLPMLVVLDRRTRAEWLKRPGFAGRVAYKAPVYTALGLLVAAKVSIVIQLFAIVLNSLAMIGVEHADIGGTYLHEFLPLLVCGLVVAGAEWYVFKLAKGSDMGKAFSMAISALGGVLAVALFITAVVNFHQKPATIEQPSPADDKNMLNDLPNSSPDGSSMPEFNPDDYKDLFNY